MTSRSTGWLLAAILPLLAGPVLALPTFAQVRAGHAPSDLTLVDRHGEPLQTVRTDPTVRRLAWVSLADYSPALRAAVVLSEDRRFAEHAGIDWSGFARSAWASASG